MLHCFSDQHHLAMRVLKGTTGWHASVSHSMHVFLGCWSHNYAPWEVCIDKWLTAVLVAVLCIKLWVLMTMLLSRVSIWVCCTGAAIAMQRWVWDSQTGVDPQASKHEKDTAKDSACKVIMNASMASGSHPHPRSTSPCLARMCVICASNLRHFTSACTEGQA